MPRAFAKQRRREYFPPPIRRIDRDQTTAASTALDFTRSCIFFVQSGNELAFRTRGRRKTMVEKSELNPGTPDWWSQFMSPVRQFGERVAEFFTPNSEASHTDSNYEIKVELPGVSEDDISIAFQDGRMTVTGEKRTDHEEKGKNYFFSERTYGRFHRAFRLPEDADPERITATHVDGVLTIKIEKIAPKKAEPKQIKITSG
jgi:HSP20 family protein